MLNKNSRIAVLRGGIDDGRILSMRTGARILNSLNQQGYITRDVVILRDGEFVEDGRIKNLSSVLEGIDMVFLGMNGQLAEGGYLQKILQQRKIPFNGSSSLNSIVAYNKKMTKDTLSKHGILTPRYFIVPKNSTSEKIKIIFKEIKGSFKSNLIFKPVFGSSSINSIIVSEYEELYKKLQALINSNEDWMIEEFIFGKEVTTAVLDHFRGLSSYVFPIVEIKLDPKYAYSTYEAKLNGDISVEPARLSYTKKDELSILTRKIHFLLNLSQYSRFDFIIDENDEIYFLEANTLPGLSNTSLYPKIVEGVGLSYDQLINHIIKTATA